MIPSLRIECIRIGGDFTDKNDLLETVAGLAKRTAVVAQISKGEILEALVEREKLGSTGLANGIAIPHANFPGLKDFIVGLVVVPQGIDFGASDKKPTRLVFFIIGPSEDRNRHIRILSSISKLSRATDLFEKLEEYDNPADIFNSLQNEIDVETVRTAGFIGPRCQFTIIVQNEKLFEEVLEILSADVDGSITVVESMNAGYFLHKMPLFSSFWNESGRSFSRIIIAVIDKRLMNDTIRRINMVRTAEPGMLLTVQDIVYWDGKIDF